MIPRLAVALALAWLAAAGADAALARQRGPARSAEPAAAEKPPAAPPPARGVIEQPKAAAPARPLTCRQYVPAAGTIIAVACPETGAGEPVPAGADKPKGAAPGAPGVQPAPSSPPGRIVDEATGCRRYLPSIGTTLAVACDETSPPLAPATAPAPPPPPAAAPAPPLPTPADVRPEASRERGSATPVRGKGPVVMADNAAHPASASAPAPGRGAGPAPAATPAARSGADDGRCREAVIRAGLGTVGSGDLAELRRGC